MGDVLTLTFVEEKLTNRIKMEIRKVKKNSQLGGLVRRRKSPPTRYLPQVQARDVPIRHQLRMN